MLLLIVVARDTILDSGVAQGSCLPMTGKGRRSRVVTLNGAP